jgi:predicted nuclease with TOPRIM domain
MKNGRMNDYTGADLMAAILSLQEATAAGFARADSQLHAEIGSLRHDMNRRFDRVDERFDDVYARFDRIDERFDDVYARFDRMDERFDRMDNRFDRMDDRFDRLEGRVAALEPYGNRPAS